MRIASMIFVVALILVIWQPRHPALASYAGTQGDRADGAGSSNNPGSAGNAAQRVAHKF